MSDAMVTFWASTARQSDKYQLDHQQRAIDALESLFTGQSDPDTTAALLALLYDPVIALTSGAHDVCEIWGMVCQAILVLGSELVVVDRLAELIDSVTKLPTPTDRSGKAIKHSWGGEYWDCTLAPMLRMYAFEWYGLCGVPWDDTDVPDYCEWNDPQSKTKFVNVVTFGARYLSQGHDRLSWLMLFEASCDLCDFNQPVTIYPEHTHQCEQCCAEVIVPAIATWLLHAGREIYKLCEAGAKYHSGCPGTESWDLKLWSAWRQKLLVSAADSKLDVGVCDIALRAANAMQSVADTHATA